MAETITWKTNGKAKERPKDTQPARIKEGRELVPFMIGSYVTHNLSNVVCMQMIPLMKPSILVDLNNDAKFRNYTY
jgi:hypothetical protein